jgi:uncharacterized membrane protein
MAGFLLFLLIGMVQFGVFVLLRGKSRAVRWTGHVTAGLLAGGIMALLPVKVPTQGFILPRFGFPLIGALSGLLTGAAERWGLFNREILQFFVTPGLSFLMALVLAAGILLALRSGSRGDHDFFPIGLTCLLIGFMTVFGYTFPRRWFKRYLE